MDITYLARTNFRNSDQLFGIKQADRLSHSYIIGKTGTGKTTLLANMLSQDIKSGRGFALLDPHGELAEKVASLVPENREQDLIYIDVADPSLQVGYNPLKQVSPQYRALVASGIIETFKKLYDSKSWGVKIEHILRNVLLTLLDQPKTDFSDVAKILRDKDFRRSCIANVNNVEIKAFWQDEFEKYHQFTRANMIAPVLNKLSAFLSNPVARKVLVENTRQVSFRQAMDQGKIVIINLAKGKIGEDVSTLLGGLMLNSLALAAFSRADTPEENRLPFMVYVDEFQTFTTLSLANMLSELRKYRVGMVLANQYLFQLEPQVSEAVLGNVGTLVSFRLGVKDAQYMAKEFHPRFDFDDIINLPNYNIYLKLLIDGNPSRPFSATTVLITPPATKK